MIIKRGRGPLPLKKLKKKKKKRKKKKGKGQRRVAPAPVPSGAASILVGGSCPQDKPRAAASTSRACRPGPHWPLYPGAGRKARQTPGGWTPPRQAWSSGLGPSLWPRCWEQVPSGSPAVPLLSHLHGWLREARWEALMVQL